ncbi:hypothetical protein DRP04_14095, partial [Archaeoglobales archaeon]
VESGDFANASEIVNLALAEFIGKYEAQGKLSSKPKTAKTAEKPPKSAEERTKNATLVSKKEVDVD